MQKHDIQHITPAILPKSFEDLVAHLDMISNTVTSVQVDVVDGVFAPNKTWPFAHDDGNRFVKIVNQEEGLPYWESIDFEIDLMVKDPSFVADQWIAAGANRVVIHAKSIGKQQFVDLVLKTSEKGVEVVIGVEISTAEIAREYIDEVVRLQSQQYEKTGIHKELLSGIQCMGIDKIGFQHNPFNPAVLDLVKEFKKQYPQIPVSVDGGVNFENAKSLFDAGASRLVVGSTVFEDDMPHEAIVELEELYKV